MSDRTILILSHLGALLVVGFLLYRPVLQNDFVFDDMTNIVQNQALQQRDFLQGLFSREYAQAWAGPDYYAPIAALSYYLDTRWHAVGGRLSSAGVHATNLVLCLAICVMAYGVFLAVAGRPGFSLVGALFFLAHPMHAENVNYVSSRPELLAALFTLGAMLASWLPSRALWARALQFFAVLFCTLFATLSGAAGLAAPLVLLAADWARIRRLRQPGAGQAAWRDRAWRAYAPMAAAFLLFVALRLALFGSLLSVQIYDPFFGDLTRAQRIWTWFQVLLRYVSLSVFPYPSTVIYNPLEEGSRAFLTNGPASLALLLAAALAVLLLSRKIPAVGLGAVWFLAALLPNLPFWPTFLVLTESKLLLPTLGLSLAIAGVVFAVANERQPLLEGARNTTVAVVAALAWTSMAALAYSRGLDWKSGPDLWRAERALHPNDETALLSTAFYQRQSGHLDEAEKTLHLALDNYTSRPAVYYELAYTYLAQGKKAEALDILNRAMQLAPAPRGDFYVKVGLLYEQLDDTEKSTAAFERGIEGDPENWSLHFLLGNTLLTRRDLAQAISQYSSALAEAPPQYAGAILLNRAMARRQSGDLDGALADAEKGVQLDPFEPRLRIELSDAWLAKGADSQVAGLDDAARSKLRTEVAEKALNVLHDGVTQISPPDRDIYLSYADLLRQVGMVDEAARWATRARELFPADPKTRLYEATLLLALDRYNEAGRLFASMMDDPKLRNHPTAIAGLGFCLFQRGANDQAARERDETALRLDRTNPLGLLLYRLLVEKGVAMDPDLVRGLPPTVIMPRGPVQPKYEQPQGPVELPVRPPTP